MSELLETVYSPFFASGFLKLDELYPGKVISVRREGPTSVNENFQLSQIRAYEVPNILEIASSTITVKPNSFSEPDAHGYCTTYEPENILKHFDSRSNRRTIRPVINANGDQASYCSCYRAKFSATNDVQLFIVELKHDKSYF